MDRRFNWPEHARLRAESQRVRAESIRVQIASVHAFCSVLECEARWESAEKAQDSMGKVWHAIAALKRHLAEPDHIPAESSGELLSALAHLDERALRIHQSLCGQTHPSVERSEPAPGPRRVSGPEEAGRDPETSR